MSTVGPIGVFDSGVGGLSVWRELARQLPHEHLLYLAEQAHVPFGSRAMDEIRRLSEGVTRFLLGHDAKVIVVACNTASAAALHHLRATFPGVPFVGMEPAVKPAAEQSQTRVVGVLATPATFQGELFASVVERFANGVQVLTQTAPGLVEAIEAGELDTPETAALLRERLQPLLEAGADRVVLGCTHYPLVLPLIQRIVGPGVRVLDPSPAIARRTAAVLDQHGLRARPGQAAGYTFVTTGELAPFQALVARLVGQRGTFRRAEWSTLPVLRLRYAE